MNMVYFPGDISNHHDLMTGRKKCRKWVGLSILQGPEYASTHHCPATAFVVLRLKHSRVVSSLSLLHSSLSGGVREVGQGASRMLQLKIRNVSVQISRGLAF